jgi:hypothetical protein
MNTLARSLRTECLGQRKPHVKRTARGPYPKIFFLATQRRNHRSASEPLCATGAESYISGRTIIQENIKCTLFFALFPQHIPLVAGQGCRPDVKQPPLARSVVIKCHPASKSPIARLKNRMSRGSVPGAPARCPQIESRTRSSAFGMSDTSIALSSGGK